MTKRTSKSSRPSSTSDASNTSTDASAGPGTVSRRDAIRIVPLMLPDALTERLPGVQAPPSPRLTYRGGALLSACEVFVVFWGAAWNAGTPQALTSQLASFFQFVLTSPLLDQLAEYDVPAYTIGHGRFVGSTVIASPEPGASVSDAAVRQFLLQQVAAGSAVPAPTPNRLYFVYLPPGTAVVQGGAKSCRAFCGYHDAIADATHGEVFYAVMPYPNCTGCLGGLAVLDALTSTSSHELAEAITDPVPGQGWYDDSQGEIGDICAWKTKVLGAYTVQLEWSNHDGACR